MRERIGWMVTALLVANPLQAKPCLQWGAPEKLGMLDPTQIDEASGIAVSTAFPSRLYHNNDSGDGPFFYVTDARGGGTRKVTVTGFTNPRDVEDIALGRCAGARNCLYIGDIGDNARARATVRFVIIAEPQTIADSVPALRIVEARYPDGAHDAEAFAIHPNGDLYLITKEYSHATRESRAARIYRLSAAQLATSTGAVQTFADVGTIDLPALLPGGYFDKVATAMDISADGKRTLILTYRQLLEWDQDLSKPLAPPHAGTFSATPIAPVPQAEAIAYAAEGDAVLYTTEAAGPAKQAPLHRQACEKH